LPLFIMLLPILRKIAFKVVLRVIFSTLLAGIFYSLWMAIFLLTRPENSLLEGLLWLLAPLITALGFALGPFLTKKLQKEEDNRFLETYVWALAGCLLGAGVVFWFGPMLIVFGMFLAGGLSMVIKETRVLFSREKST